ncbi:a-factor receptor [Ceratobasidium sp. 370]|nr:a-factor receptor [Ceratobasidium sp. 370]
MLFNSLLALAAVASVSAHGFIQSVTVGGKTFSGPFPFSNKNAASPVRKITTTFPITSATDPNMNCGIGAAKASLVAAANPGDKVTISWKSGQNKNWGHTLGPIMTYLAQVPAGQTADKFDTKNAKFFKIAQTGQTGGAGTGWVQASISEFSTHLDRAMELIIDAEDGRSYTLTLPTGLPAGDYIMRHELIALHFAQKKDGAQFYPACIQLRVGGGSASPKAISAQTVSFPGGYTPNDKSLFVPDLFKKSFVYTFPGPALFKSTGAAAVSNKSGNSGNSTTNEPESSKPKHMLVGLYLSDMRDPAFPVFCAVGALLCILPLPWHWQARNTGTLLYLGWTLAGCLMFLINSVVWDGNMNDSAPVWCDITSRLVLALSVGITAASLCVQRRLYRIATAKRIDPCGSGKRDMIIDLVLGLGLPALVMVLYYIVQYGRYGIIEDIGCWPAIVNTPLVVPTTLMWPVLISFASFIYAGLTIRAFTKRRRQFSRILSESEADLTMSRFFRLMALAVTNMLFVLPLALYFLISDMVLYPLSPWTSWQDTHAMISQVFTFPQDVLQAQPGAKTCLELNRWSIPGCAFLFFMYFGLPGEAIRQYKAVLWRVVAPLGFKPPAPKPRRQTSTWTKRLVNGTVTGGQDAITLPSTAHTTFNASHSSFCPAIVVDDKPEYGVVQEPLQVSIKDLESQT